MSVIILRRPKLGLSVKHLVAKSELIDKVVRNDRRLPDDLSLQGYVVLCGLGNTVTTSPGE